MKREGTIRELPLEGLYHLVIRLTRLRWLRVGALGLQRFPIGTYIYTGSAKRGLSKRINHHLRREKKYHRHIDYLTGIFPVLEVFVDTSGKHSECERHQMVAGHHGAEVIVPGFGASDCKCSSHLAYFKKKPELHHLPDVWAVNVGRSYCEYRPAR